MPKVLFMTQFNKFNVILKKLHDARVKKDYH